MSDSTDSSIMNLLRNRFSLVEDTWIRTLNYITLFFCDILWLGEAAPSSSIIGGGGWTPGHSPVLCDNHIPCLHLPNLEKIIHLGQLCIHCQLTSNGCVTHQYSYWCMCSHSDCGVVLQLSAVFFHLCGLGTTWGSPIITFGLEITVMHVQCECDRRRCRHCKVTSSTTCSCSFFFWSLTLKYRPRSTSYVHSWPRRAHGRIAQLMVLLQVYLRHCHRSSRCCWLQLFFLGRLTFKINSRSMTSKKQTNKQTNKKNPLKNWWSTYCTNVVTWQFCHCVCCISLVTLVYSALTETATWYSLDCMSALFCMQHQVWDSLHCEKPWCSQCV